MSCVLSMSEYVSKCLSSVSGMKALLLDAHTSGMIALVMSQTDVINREVFLTDRIDIDNNGADASSLRMLNSKGEYESSSSSSSSSKETFHHLKAVAFIRPSAASIHSLKAMMRSGKFKDYYIYFSNICSDELLRSLAECDEYELIRNVSELYADYFALHDALWHCNQPITKPLYAIPNYWSSDEKRMLDRNSESIVSLLLSFKVKADIRYAGSSELAKMIAMDVSRRQKDESDLFTFQTQAPLLLILDRVDDPVTPLLTQWTYQAMVHELLGITQNRVSLASAPGIKKDLQEVVLSPAQDHFYKGSMYLNFGDLGTSVKELVSNYQRKTQNHARLDTIEDMQRFVDNYPEFRSMSGTVSKHVAIMTELSRLVETRQLMRVSEVEQELACTQDHSSAMDAVFKFISNHALAWDDKLRLVCLYALRYENQPAASNQIHVFKKILREQALNDSKLLRKVGVIDILLKHAGNKARGGDLFGNQTVLRNVAQWMKSGLKGVENIYTQHKPLLVELLTLLVSQKLKTNGPLAYPYTDAATANANAAAKSNKYRLVLIYIIGGTTYEEALAVENFNNANAGVRVVMGSNYVHNSASFIADLMAGSSSSSSSSSSAADLDSIHISQ